MLLDLESIFYARGLQHSQLARHSVGPDHFETSTYALILPCANNLFQYCQTAFCYKILKYGLTPTAACAIKFLVIERGAKSSGRRSVMKIKVAQKDVLGYIFLLVLAAACIVIGIRVLHNHHVTS